MHPEPSYVPSWKPIFIFIATVNLFTAHHFILLAFSHHTGPRQIGKSKGPHRFVPWHIAIPEYDGHGAPDLRRNENRGNLFVFNMGLGPYETLYRDVDVDVEAIGIGDGEWSTTTGISIQIYLVYQLRSSPVAVVFRIWHKGHVWPLYLNRRCFNKRAHSFHHNGKCFWCLNVNAFPFKRMIYRVAFNELM